MNYRLIYLLLVCFIFSSCDTLTDGESVFLRVELDEICFEVNRIQDGVQVTVLSDASNVLDIGPALARDNLSKEDVIGARLTEATVRLIFPVESDLSIIEDAALSLTAFGTSRQVAGLSTLPSSRNASLAPTNSDVSSIVSASTFQATLQFDGASDINERVVIEGSITIEVEVQDL